MTEFRNDVRRYIDGTPTIPPVSNETTPTNQDKDLDEMASVQQIRDIVRDEVELGFKNLGINLTNTIMYWVNPKTGKQERVTATRLFQILHGNGRETAEAVGVADEKLDAIADAVIPNES